ncbi:unnamed protein product [Cyberlindnera jadinii]|uniref:TLC domain-containing protein n=1 Tax=Cyberlindnera jadinii (strain ATCC 18201 / CBS 1600 / BCRC 20928 / JCM 3617 / NBRC 0987 / NRRL Y-1542) TaxID=983966 RepID=A0A0H5C940_CYBJN|nr:hypothetical protein CYBJADRAFT_167964 [Cyberlindnera jadinii NRRL Y-1542]ODV73401.1 hypothetical protein CYBJADRAFT_167964 [Cyberlindnera jadinii NRRL Y-1542]CEP24582.1 unnamed protein product [Cyberlindnera jadinii]
MVFEVITATRYDDPLAFLIVPFVDDYLKPLYTHQTLDNHIHELVACILFYHAIYLSSSVLAPMVFAETFRTLPRKTRIDFNIHVVSMIQSVLILFLIIPLFTDPVLVNDRVFGYTPYCGFVTTAALGYFIWDAIISLVYVNYFGVSFLVHGVVSACVFYIGLGPFIAYYSGIFILFELSTPFLNLRWFGLKFPQVFPSWFQLVNNAVLILIFFFVRICYGWYQAAMLFGDFYDEYQDPRFNTIGAIVIFTGNMILNVLNLYWFYRMVKVAYAILADMFTGSNERDEAKKDI